jgi:hypothetical protein
MAPPSIHLADFTKVVVENDKIATFSRAKFSAALELTKARQQPGLV